MNALRRNIDVEPIATKEENKDSVVQLLEAEVRTEMHLTHYISYTQAC